MKIIVNGEEKNVDKQAVSYQDIVVLAWGEKNRDYCYSMTYSTKVKPGSDSRRSGSLHSGQSVQIEEGMVFSCMDTSNA